MMICLIHFVCPCSSGISLVLEVTDWAIDRNRTMKLSYIPDPGNILYNGDSDE